MLAIIAFAFLFILANGSIEFGISGGEASLQVITGSKFSIAMEAVPSAGYSWSLVGDLAECLAESSREFRPRKSKPTVLGGKVLQEIAFSALSVCQTDVTFKYSRPWEEKSESTPYIRIHLRVINSEDL